MYGLSSNGWMDGELFHQWFTYQFLAHAPPSRPLLLLMNGYSSHFVPDAIRMVAEESVILFCLPPHTTHLTQPLDKRIFALLKSYWKEACHNYTSKNGGKMTTRFTFSQVFSHVWFQAMTMANIISGFRMTGIYPLNCLALHPKEQCSGKFRPDRLAQKTGLKFIPLYSPARRCQHQQHFTEEENSLFGYTL